MKTLHVVINGEIAGGQIVCLQIIEALLQRGCQTLVVSPTEGPFTYLLRSKNVPVFFIPLEKTYSFYKAVQLSKLIKKERVDIVHTHGMVPQNVQARLAAHLAGVPCISHIHVANVFNSHPLIRKYQVGLDNWTSGFCHRLIAVSNSTQGSLVEQGIPAGRIEVIPNGIDSEKVRPRLNREEIFRKFQLDPRRRLVGLIGRLCPTKGQEDFLRAAKAVAEQIPDAAWMIVGKDMEFRGEYEQQLKRLAQSLGLNGKVIFTGHQDDPLSLLNAMEFLVLPSRAEGAPLVILEAMALKKAVIASAVGGIPEVVQEGVTGALIPSNDVQALSLALVKFLKNPEQVKRMGEAGFQRIRTNFSEERFLRRIFEIYNSSFGYGKNL